MSGIPQEAIDAGVSRGTIHRWASEDGWPEALQLIEDALFLRMYGERPPGAPPDPRKETWADWDQRAEAWMRARQKCDPMRDLGHE